VPVDLTETVLEERAASLEATDSGKAAEERFAAYQEMESAGHDSAGVEEPIGFEPVKPAETVAAKLTVEEASAKIGEKVLQALEGKFNGQLTEVRAPDQKDLFF
jgi:hypothetical protein